MLTARNTRCGWRTWNPNRRRLQRFSNSQSIWSSFQVQQDPQESVSTTQRQIDGTATTRPPSSLSTDTLVVVTLDASWGVLPDPRCHVGFTLTPSVFPKARHVCFSQWGNAFWLCLDVLFHWQTAQWTALCLSSIKAANFRLVWVFFPFFFSCAGICFKHSQRETEGRQDIPTQEKEMPAITCYASWTLKSPVLGGERGGKPEPEWLTKH